MSPLDGPLSARLVFLTAAAWASPRPEESEQRCRAVSPTGEAVRGGGGRLGPVGPFAGLSSRETKWKLPNLGLNHFET